MFTEQTDSCFRVLWVPGFSFYKTGYAEESDIICCPDSVIRRSAADHGMSYSAYIDKLTAEKLMTLNEISKREAVDTNICFISAMTRLIHYQNCKKTVRSLLLEDCFGSLTEQYLQNRLPFETVVKLEKDYLQKTGGVSIYRMLQSLDSCTIRVLICDEAAEYFHAPAVSDSEDTATMLYDVADRYRGQVLAFPAYPGIMTMIGKESGSDSIHILQVPEEFYRIKDFTSHMKTISHPQLSGRAIIVDDLSPATLHILAADAYNEGSMLFYDHNGAAVFQGCLHPAEVSAMGRCHHERCVPVV